MGVSGPTTVDLRRNARSDTRLQHTLPTRLLDGTVAGWGCSGLVAPSKGVNSHSGSHSLHSLPLQSSLTPLTLTPNLAQSASLQSPTRSKSVVSNGRNGRNGRQKTCMTYKTQFGFPGLVFWSKSRCSRIPCGEHATMHETDRTASTASRQNDQVFFAKIAENRPNFPKRLVTLTPGSTHTTHSHSGLDSLRSLSLRARLTPLTLTPDSAHSPPC